MNIQNEFVPYEQALALKELGFDEQTLGFYDYPSKNFIKEESYGNFKGRYKYRVTTPLFQQAFRWFREEYGVECFIKHFKPNDGYPNGYYCISNPNKYYSDSISDWCFTNFKSYEEAELECLKKLIEIVKNK